MASIIRDLIEVRPAAGNLTDRDIKRFKRLWLRNREEPRRFHLKPSERHRQKHQRALWLRKQEER